MKLFTLTSLYLTKPVSFIQYKHHRSLCDLERICAFLPSYLPTLVPLFSSASPSVCISYSSTSWHEHSSHTEMMKGWGEERGRKQEKRLRERLEEGGRCMGMKQAGVERGWWTERGRWDGMKLKHTKSCPVLLQRTKTYVFIVLWMHTGRLCRGQ